jgi:hypothetical protein
MGSSNAYNIRRRLLPCCSIASCDTDKAILVAQGGAEMVVSGLVTTRQCGSVGAELQLLRIRHTKSLQQKSPRSPCTESKSSARCYWLGLYHCNEKSCREAFMDLCA